MGLSGLVNEELPVQSRGARTRVKDGQEQKWPEILALGDRDRGSIGYDAP